MTKDIGGECTSESQPSKGQRLPLAHSGSREGLVTPRICKTLKSHSGAVTGSSTISFGRVRLSDTSSRFDIQTPDFGVMDTAATVTSGGGSRPRTGREFFGFDRQGPAGVELYDISPTNGVLLDRVGDDNPLIAKADFWSDQEDMDTRQYKECDADTRHFAGHPALIKARPNEESAEYNSDSCKDQVAARTVLLEVIHVAILSYLTAVKGQFSCSVKSRRPPRLSQSPLYKHQHLFATRNNL